MILLALLPWLKVLDRDPTGNGIGMWVLLDTSASQMTMDMGRSRHDRARDEIRSLVASAVKTASEDDLCLRLSTFDLVRQDRITTSDLSAFYEALDSVAPRYLGTNLNLVRQAFLDVESHDADCPVTHIIVVSDQAPVDVRRDEKRVSIWRRIGNSQPNIGIAAIEPQRNPLTGQVLSTTVELSAYGEPKPANLVVVGPGKRQIVDEELVWQGSLPERRSRITVPTTQSGRYELHVTGSDSNGFDDNAIVELPDTHALTVDWRLQDRSIPVGLGWTLDDQGPNMRVIPANAPVPRDDVPTLIVGVGFASNLEPVPVQYFAEFSPIIADLNFDAVEKVVPPATPNLPEDFTRVLYAKDDRSWAAQSFRRAAAYVAGLPQGQGETLAVSTTLFFNSVRWLLDKGDPPSIYTVTDAIHPIPEGTLIALHPSDSDTFAASTSTDPLPVFSAGPFGRDPGAGQPLWILTAMVLLLAERYLAIWRGET